MSEYCSVLFEDGLFRTSSIKDGVVVYVGDCWKLHLRTNGLASFWFPFASSYCPIWIARSNAQQHLANLGVSFDVSNAPEPEYFKIGWLDFGDGVRKAVHLSVRITKPLPKSFVGCSDGCRRGTMQPMSAYREGYFVLDFGHSWG